MQIEKAADNHYDLILIGPGMGALTVARSMAQLRKRDWSWSDTIKPEDLPTPELNEEV